MCPGTPGDSVLPCPVGDGAWQVRPGDGGAGFAGFGPTGGATHVDRFHRPYANRMRTPVRAMNDAADEVAVTARAVRACVVAASAAFVAMCVIVVLTTIGGNGE